jgi:type III pantothenate kinase
MLLAIDAGNTNLVFALVEDGMIRARWRIATDARRTADQYAVWLHQLLALEGFTKADVSAVIIGSVVPRALHNLEVLASKYFGVEPLIAGEPPVEWGDLIVIDFGTATTFDAVDYNGAYKGGIIAPGINLSLDALVAAAARLPRVAIEAPETETVIGRTTEDQMHIGIYWGYVAMIEGLAARLKAEIGRPVTVVATGGLATLFDTHTDIFDVIEGDLTIQGLAMLYARRQDAA